MTILRIARVLSGVVGCAVLLAASVAGAQSTSRSPLDPPPNGPRKTEPATVTLVGVTLHPRPGEVVADTTVVLRDGKIVEVGPSRPLQGGIVGRSPAGGDGLVRDGRGLHVYAGFIEPLIEVAVSRPDVNGPGAHYNSRVTPQRSALEKGSAGIDAGLAGTLRSMGFCAAGIGPRGGVFRGLGAVVSLAEKPRDVSAQQPHAYLERAFHSIALDAGRGEDDDTPDDARWSRYPSSQMGAIAVIRQTLIDADWQAAERAAGRFTEPANALDALARRGAPDGEGGGGGDVPLLVNVEDELEVIRAAKIAAEFKRPLIVIGSGQEYQRLAAIQALGVPVVLPLNFPPAPKVETIGQAESVPLRELMQWEQAPTSPRRVVAAGIPAALTTGKLGDKLGGPGSFMAKLSTAIKHGLGKDQALAMLTTGPAKMLGVEDRLGTVEVGKVANLVIADGELFTDVADAPKKGEPGYVAPSAASPGRPGKIIEVYIDGQRHVVGSGGRERRDLAGAWAVTLGAVAAEAGGDAVTRTLEIDDAWPPGIALVETRAGKEGAAKEGAEAKAANKPDVKRAKAGNVSFTADPSGDVPSAVAFTIDLEPLGRGAGGGAGGVVSVAATVLRGVDGLRLVGQLRRPDGATVGLTATRTGDVVQKDPPAAGPLDGTWTQIIDGKPTRPGDGQGRVYLVVKAGAGAGGVETESKLQFKRGEGKDQAAEKDLKIEVVKNQLGGESPRAELTVTGLDPAKPEAATRVVVTGEKGAGDAGGTVDRLVVTAGEDGGGGATTLTLGRYRATPETDAIAAIPAALGLPFGPYALAAWPEATPVVIRGATIWTCADGGADNGVIENGTIVLGGGTIGFVGTAAAGADYLARVRLAGPVMEIDGKGLFVSPGIIDAHSHTGISKGVNEGGQAVTAEVRIGDVTEPDSVSWYRQLAGGVTAVNTLHGSANAIGGQNQVSKIRWGCPSPDDMHIKGAAGGIKFALGENPKQSNWGDRAVTRYPQTRMGVETIIRDRLVAAREYAAARGKAGWRRDLELEAIAEILEGKRLVHCHAYRQDEMLMLCRIAGEFGFKIGTFQHALEGYKVADEVRANAIGASMFSDWWAFKVEVQDAIPQGGPIMHERGNVVSYNSDSDELARRMNVEAGKAVRYSGSAATARLAPAEALKFVSINPARQLKIDGRTGSLEAGKDADVAVWSGQPTSSLSRCVRTFVDGRELFSIEKDRALRAGNERERARLIQKALGVKDAAGAVEKAGGEDAAEKPKGRQTLMERMARQAEDVRREHYLNLYLRGLDPRFYRSGDCGCELTEILGN